MIWSGSSHGGGGGEVVDVLCSVPMLMSKVCGSESKVSDVVGTGTLCLLCAGTWKLVVTSVCLTNPLAL